MIVKDDAQTGAPTKTRDKTKSTVFRMVIVDPRTS
jgi:hypothetical protein